MARYGRNDRCPCGSGRKAKRCCGVSRGPGREELERAFLADEALRAAPVLVALTDPELQELFEEMLELPALDLSLVVPLPAIVGPELSRLLDAVAEDDPDQIEDALPAALGRVDGFVTRASLARAILALREAGRITAQLAALAIVHLEGGRRSLLGASLIQAAAIATGTARTPAGLIVAAA